MRFAITTRISLDSGIEPNHLLQILEPENDSLSNVRIESKVEQNKVITIISGMMKIGTLNRTIDDILQTASLSEKVAESTNSTEIQDHEL